jgi:hypothetical protein
MSDVILTANSTPQFDHDAYRRAVRAAEATECGISGCDGDGHDDGDPSDWSHRMGHSEFDGAVDVEFRKFPGDRTVAVHAMQADGEVTAAELRADADLYEAYPAWLRARADELDAFRA